MQHHMFTTINTVLQQAGYTTTTINLYRKAVYSFLEWTSSHHVRIMSLQQLDMVLNEYVVHLWSTGKGKQAAVTAVYGVRMYIAEAADHLPNAIKSLRGWGRLHKTTSYPPMSWDMCVLISCQLTRAGYWHHGVGCLLAFTCYLRVGELCGIQHGDVADIGDPRMGRNNTCMCIRLAHTKTGSNKWVTVRHPVVAQLMRSLLSSSRPGNYPLFPFSPSHFRSMLHAACEALGIDHVGYVPHSLRHGGATHDHIMGVPMEDILLRGRWASNATARMYIQTGKAMLLSQSIPASVLRTAARVASNVAYSMRLAHHLSHP